MSDNKYTVSIYVNYVDLAEQDYFPTMDDCQNWAAEQVEEWKSEVSNNKEMVLKIELTKGALTYLKGIVDENFKIIWENKKYKTTEIPLTIPTWDLYENPC